MSFTSSQSIGCDSVKTHPFAKEELWKSKGNIYIYKTEEYKHTHTRTYTHTHTHTHTQAYFLHDVFTKQRPFFVRSQSTFNSSSSLCLKPRPLYGCGGWIRPCPLPYTHPTIHYPVHYPLICSSNNSSNNCPSIAFTSSLFFWMPHIIVLEVKAL